MTTAPDEATERPTLQESVPPVREWGRVFLIGIVMGSADAVPGVSGGTIALIAGVYVRLIAAIARVTPDRLVQGARALTPLDGGVSGRDAVAVLEEVDGWFLLALLAGVATAVVLVTRAVHVAQQETPALLFGFFFGLIAASAVVLLRAASVRTAPEVAAAAAGFLIAFVLSGEATVLGRGGLAVVFLAGTVAVSAMILPGVSGSLLLVVLGQYTRMATTLSEFVDGLARALTGGPLDGVTGPGAVVVTFVAGGLVGLFTVSRAVRRALDANREVTLAFLVTLVVGALRAPVARVGQRPGFSTDVVVAFGVAALAGAVLVLAVDWYAVDLDLDAV